ncbi:hypothetical protein KCP75_11495 [Salmonella enterica subsp. enterica]|nr:hypothetical protein KCP75_11495 [Salmonella enterica subsp. enterica]
MNRSKATNWDCFFGWLRQPALPSGITVRFLSMPTAQTKSGCANGQPVDRLA